MKLPHPIEISLKDFFLNGRFDYLEPGQDMAYVRSNFADANCESDMGNGFHIWQYGDIELHFDGDILMMIYCDYFDLIDGGPALKIDRWVLENSASLTLSKMLNILCNEGADFMVHHDTSLKQSSVYISKSRVLLYFDANDEYIEPERYGIRAFCLNAPDYNKFYKAK